MLETFGFNAIGAYLLVVALAALFAAVLVWQPFKSVRTVNVWLASGMVGVLLGCAIPYALMEANGYTVSRAPISSSGAMANPAMMAGGGAGGGCGMGEMKGMMAGGGGGCGAGMSGMMAGAGGGCGTTPATAGAGGTTCPVTGKPMGGTAAGGAQAAQTKPALAMAVQKLNLLTGDIAITLSAEQAAAVAACLKDIEKSPQMSDDEAKAKHGQLMAALNDGQKARLEAIAVPCPNNSAGHEECSASKCSAMAGGSCPMSVGATAQNAKGQNPFQADAVGKSVKSLRDRLASKATVAKAEAPKATAAKP